MGTARRVYLYLVSAVTLLITAIGLYDLVGTLLDRLSLLPGSGLAAVVFDRQGTSLAIALIVIGGPLYLIHRRSMERGWAADIEAEGDRPAPLRGFYYALVGTIALVAASLASFTLASRAIGVALAVTPESLGGSDLTDPAAMLIVAGPIWWAHQRRRGRDIRHDRLHGRTAAITRFHRYAWAAAGLLILVVATSQVLQTTAAKLIGSASVGTDDTWRAGLASAIAAIVVGAILFAIHAFDARATIRDVALIGEDDRTSRLRATYFAVVLLVAIVEGMASVALSLSALAERALGVAVRTSAPAFLEDVIAPLLIAVPFAIAGLMHWRAWRREAATRSVMARAEAERVALHLTAGAGLTFLAVGGAILLGRLLEVATGSPMDALARSEVASLASVLLVGAAAWIPAWAVILRRRTATPLAERRAAIGRDYLYLVVGASLLAGIPSAAFTLYRVIDALLAARGLALTTELADPLAVLLVAVVIAAYHGRLLVGDLRFTAATAATPDPAPANVRHSRTPVPVMAVPRLPPDAPSLDLVLRAPVGSDLFAIADDLRAQLPPGALLEPARLSSIARSGAASHGTGTTPPRPAADQSPTLPDADHVIVDA